VDDSGISADDRDQDVWRKGAEQDLESPLGAAEQG
jgi:hypothetical protein